MTTHPWTRSAALALLILLLAPPLVLAQITVDIDDYSARLGQTHSLDLVVPTDTLAMQALANLTGPDQTFDFTALDLSAALPLQVEYVPLPNDVPGIDLSAFTHADHVLHVAPRTPTGEREGPNDSALWLFRGTTSEGVSTHGFFTDLGLSALDSLSLPDSLTLPDSLPPDLPIPLDSLTLADTLLAYASPPLRTMALPLTASTSWSGSSITAVEWGEVVVLMTATVDAQVDGYGALVTPDGTAACLRLNTTYTLQIPLTEYSATFQIVQYVTEGNLSALLVLDEDGAPLLAGYGRAIGPSSAEPTPSTAQLTLAPAAPHPFRDAATLHFTLPKPVHVRLRLFDVLGRKVATLVDAPQPAGSHDVHLDASNLPSGLYVAHLQAGDQVLTHTLIRTR